MKMKKLRNTKMKAPKPGMSKTCDISKMPAK